MNWIACCAVKTVIKWPLVKLLQSIKSCKIYILYDTTSTIIEASSLQTAWTIFWVWSSSVYVSAIIFLRQKGRISVLSAERHHDHWDQQQRAQVSVSTSSLPNAVQRACLVHTDKSGVRKFYVFLLWWLVVHIPQNHL